MRLLNRSALVLGATAVLLGSGAVAAQAIVGGHDAPRTYGAAAVSITFPGLGVGHCGGALVAPRFILTAAHCASDQASAPTPIPVTGPQITVRVGSTSRSVGGQTATGMAVFLHPDWQWATNPTAPVSDLALVELDHPILGVPLLPLDGRPADADASVRLIGWGLTAYPGTAADLPDRLQQLDTTQLPNTACTGGFIGVGEICVGPGACPGDSGSPALTGRPWSQVGIASRETDQTDPCGQPTVYTDTTVYADWIRTTIREQRALPCTCRPAPAAPDGQSDRTGLLKLTLTSR